MTDIVIIDEQPIFRRGLSQIINGQDDLQVIKEMTDSEFSVDWFFSNRPDLVILELNKSSPNGLQNLAKLKQIEPSIRVIIFTMSSNQGDIYRAIHLGADGYIFKDICPNDLIESLRKCISGQMVVDKTIQEIVNQALTHRSPENLHPALQDLTDRETDVLRLVATGLSNKAIGNNLSIAEGTVKVHVKRVLAKLNFRSRVEAAIFAHEHSAEI